MSNVTKLFWNSDDPDDVLELSKGEFHSVVVIGYDKNNDIDVRSSTNLNAEDVNWLIDRFKHKLLNGDYSAGVDLDG